MQLRQRIYKGNQICILPHVKGDGRNCRNPFRLHFALMMRRS